MNHFAASELFERTFQEGMELVEETASYLDGEGRQESKLLSRDAALSYAGESMRLTTRLMQVASWLLVQRAVREGDMQADAACDERYRLSAEAVCLAGAPELGDGSGVGVVENSAEHRASIGVRLEHHIGEVAAQDVITGVAAVVAELDVDVIAPGLTELVALEVRGAVPAPHR